MDMIQSVISASDSIYAVPNERDRLEVMSMYGGRVKRITAVLPALFLLSAEFISAEFILRKNSGGKKTKKQSVHCCTLRDRASLIYILKSEILILKLKFNNVSSLRTSCAFNYFEFNFLTFV